MNETAVNPHSVANFRPEEYEVQDYLDNQRPRYFGGPIGAYEQAVESWKREIAAYFPTSACVQTTRQQLPEHNIHRCRHCGNGNVRYIVAVKHLPTGVNLVFGSDCVEHLGFANRDAFKAAQVRARAEAGHARLKVWHARTEFLNAHPELAAAVEKVDSDSPLYRANSFARDIVNKLNQYGSLSPRQVECLLASLKRDEDRVRIEEERAAEKARMLAAGVKAPNGRVAVEGEVLTTRVQQGQFGTTLKWLVKLDNGAKVWSTIPSSIDYSIDTLKGCRVRFTATFELSKDDQTFAFGSRPTKGSVL